MSVLGLLVRRRWCWLLVAVVVLLTSVPVPAQADIEERVPATKELLARPPLCPPGLVYEVSSSRCSGVVSVDALKKCAAVPVGSSVVLRDGKCVVSSVSVVDPVVSCFATTEDPLSWVFDSGSGQCVATILEDYEVKTGERRVPPFSERVRVAPFTRQVRVAPFNRQVRVAPFTKQVRVPPFSVRVRVAPFTERVSVRESYSYTVRERS